MYSMYFVAMCSLDFIFCFVRVKTLAWWWSYKSGGPQKTLRFFFIVATYVQTGINVFLEYLLWAKVLKVFSLVQFIWQYVKEDIKAHSPTQLS